MNTIYPWNAIYTHANCEKKVSRLLEKKRIVHYFPENKIMADETDQKLVTTPLIPSIIFIQASDSKQLSSLAQLSNVTNLVYWQQNPAVFPSAEIDLLRNFMEAHETVQLVKTGLHISNNLSPKETVNPHHFSSDNTHTIYLPSLGYSLSAKAAASTNVKLVRKNATRYRATESLAYIIGFKTSGSWFE